MTCREPARFNHVHDYGIERKKSQTVGDDRSRLAQLVCKFFLRKAVFFHKRAVCPRFFYRVEILSLKVFYESDLRHFGLCKSLYYSGNERNPRDLARPQSSLACDKLVSAAVLGAYENGLYDAVVLYARREFVERVLVKALSRLIGIGVYEF